MRSPPDGWEKAKDEGIRNGEERRVEGENGGGLKDD